MPTNIPIKPAVIVFDVIETLFPLEPLRAKLEGAGLPGHALETWFAQLLRNAFALNATDSYSAFRDIAVDALQAQASAHGQTLTPDQLSGIIGTFAQLDAYDDVAPTMARLAESGIRLVALTNGSAEVTKKLLERAKVSHFIEHVISVDEVQLWKPRKEVYLHCAQRCGVEPSAMMLIAAHSWDVHGANKAGLRTAFLRRQGQSFAQVMQQPELYADDLHHLIRQILPQQG
ncbi:MAG: haloacid dehalogenase type II [Halopseudomonas sp.]